MFLPATIFRRTWPLPSLLLFSLLFANFGLSSSARSFTIDQKQRVFLKDGLPFRYISGEMHYFRIHPSLWQDRLHRYRAAGLNAVQLYVPWNFHETTPGNFNFGGDRDVAKFIRMAQRNELNVLLRLGPYICAEFEFGGLPWWLTKNQTQIALRRSNELYLGYLRRWYIALLPVLKPLLYKNGGPILMLQIENEYGSVLCDHSYMRWLRDLTRKELGDDVVLYTTDGPSDGMLSCGTIENTLSTVDFRVPGGKIEEAIKGYFDLQQKYTEPGPRVNSEFYTVWFAMWGDKSMCRQQIQPVIESMDAMWAMNASFSILMFHGGTSYGFWSGKETDGPIVTSYDFGAPISEEGAITPLYEAIREWIGRRPNWPNVPLPIPANRTGANIRNVFGVKLSEFIRTLNSSSHSSSSSSSPDPISHQCIHSKDVPLNFESFDQDHGFVWYSTFLEVSGNVLEAPELRDHAYVYLDGKFQGNMSVCDRTGCAKKLFLNGTGGAQKGQRLDILVENIGRLTYPVTKVDPRGLFSPLFLDGKVLGKQWIQCGVDLHFVFENVKKQVEKGKIPISSSSSADYHQSAASEPSIYAASFPSPSGVHWPQQHTFFDSRGWGHGVLLLNNFNLGRYWPTQGPQMTLFVPGAIMQPHNFVVLVELAGRQKDNSYMDFVDHPIYNYNAKFERKIVEHRRRIP